MSSELARTCPEAFVACIAPDVCLTPGPSGMVAVPYMIFARLDAAEDTNAKHTINGYPAFTLKSRIPQVEGDEAGTGGGIVSGVNQGYCRPLASSSTHKSGGEWIIREGDLFAMNCAGPEGPANTYGRLVIMNQGAVAPSVSVSKAEATVVDQTTGKTITEMQEVTRNPETGAVTETRQRTVIDPKTGHVDTLRADITTHADGRRTYVAHAGTFDPETQTFGYRTTTGELPADAAEVDPDEVSVDEEGRLFLGTDERGGGKALSDDAEISDDDPEVLNDPEVKAALEEQEANEAEIDETNGAMRWEGAKLGVDAVGIVDPTPVSDLVGAGMALVDGDWGGAGLSVVAAVVPFVGDVIAKAVKGTRAAAKFAMLSQKLKKLIGKQGKIAQTLKEARRKIKEALKKKRTGGGAAAAAKPKSPGDGGFSAKLGKDGKAAEAGSSAPAPKVRPKINHQKQAGHVKGTPQYKNKAKQDPGSTSCFDNWDDAERYTQEAWEKGTPLPKRKTVKDYEFGHPVGTGPGGGKQSRVRVHEDKQGVIHGHPVGPEKK